MRIKSFDLYNHKVKVIYQKKIRGKLLGNCDPNTHKIWVATHSIDGTPLPDSAIDHNLKHEIVHYWFKMLGRDDLYLDEILVDGLAGMICQYEATNGLKKH